MGLIFLVGNLALLVVSLKETEGEITLEKTTDIYRSTLEVGCLRPNLRGQKTPPATSSPGKKRKREHLSLWWRGG